MVQFDYKLVVVVRKDLGLSAGKLAVQVAHASVSCAQWSSKNNKRTYDAWFNEGQKKVVVKVDNLKDLYFYKELAKKDGLTTSLISDAGLTEVAPGTVTCLGIGPDKADVIDKITGQLKLL